MTKATRRRARLRESREPRPAEPELNAASRAQLGRDPERREYRPRPDDASVQDPLRDRPDED
jgi:hypothetical protein